MNIYRSVRAVTGASGDGAIDWDAVARAAQASTEPGSLAMSDSEKQAYAADVRDARARVRDVGGVEFDVPRAVEVQNRHHWIDANVDTFSRVMKPLEEHTEMMLPGVSRVLNTGTMSFMLAFLGRNVLGQYDPLLLADGDEHALYFVRPNIRTVAAKLDVDYDRFRRWIAFHEVTHAAEFGAAPWLSDHLEARMEDGIAALAEGNLDRQAFRDLDAAMTVVEGYAELLMDHAFDDEYEDLRAKIDAQRKGRGPIAKFVRRALGLGIKRRQYERGKAFFEHIAEQRSVEATNAVWEHPDNLPTEGEIGNPDAWIRRVDP